MPAIATLTLLNAPVPDEAASIARGVLGGDLLMSYLKDADPYLGLRMR